MLLRPIVGDFEGFNSYVEDLKTNKYGVEDSRIQIQIKNPSKYPFLEYYTYHWFKQGSITKTQRHYMSGGK